jgi:hypothetical protein
LFAVATFAGLLPDEAITLKRADDSLNTAHGRC